MSPARSSSFSQSFLLHVPLYCNDVPKQCSEKVESVTDRIDPPPTLLVALGPSVPRQKQRTPELRDHVLSVAVGLLAREGVAGFTARSVAREAETSTPAVYELFGDKGGLIRELFFEGFRLLHRHLETLPDSDDPRADLVALVTLYRSFVRE